MSWVALAVGVVGTGYKIYDSAHKASQAKKLAASNKRPIFKADGSIAQVYDLATSEVNDTRLQDYASQQMGQSLSTSIDAVLKSGGKADFGVVHSQYGSQFQAALAQIDKSRDAKVAAFNNAAYNKAQSMDTEFSYNKDAPFKDIKQQEAMLRQQSSQSASDAVSAAATTAANYGIATTRPGEYANERSTFASGSRLPDATPPAESFRQPAAVIPANAGPSPGALAAARAPVPNNVAAGAVNTRFDYGDIDYTRPLERWDPVLGWVYKN